MRMHAPQILSTASHFRELLSIRYSSPLFRLATATAIQSCVKFYNTGPAAEPGVIVMAIRWMHNSLFLTHR